jgi:hypothetical protein
LVVLRPAVRVRQGEVRARRRCRGGVVLVVAGVVEDDAARRQVGEEGGVAVPVGVFVWVYW